MIWRIRNSIRFHHQQTNKTTRKQIVLCGVNVWMTKIKNKQHDSDMSDENEQFSESVLEKCRAQRWWRRLPRMKVNQTYSHHLACNFSTMTLRSWERCYYACSHKIMENISTFTKVGAICVWMKCVRVWERVYFSECECVFVFSLVHLFHASYSCIGLLLYACWHTTSKYAKLVEQ